MGCASRAERIDRYAHKHSLIKQEITGQPFRHVIYYNSGNPGFDTWWLFIDGDGFPWLQRYYIAEDPTADSPLMLKLMAQLQEPRVYLGRPCYLGHATDYDCRAYYWTFGRYSTPVIDSMRTALNVFIQEREIKSIVAVGHSGGGTLAWLMARDIPQIKAVVTLAGNLDTAAWTSRHEFTDLTGSLNPSEEPPLPDSVFQLHVVGTRDANIDRAWVENFSRRQYNAQLLVVEGVNHTCCWLSIWPQVLEIVTKKLESR